MLHIPVEPALTYPDPVLVTSDGRCATTKDASCCACLVTRRASHPFACAESRTIRRFDCVGSERRGRDVETRRGGCDGEGGRGVHHDTRRTHAACWRLVLRCLMSGVPGLAADFATGAYGIVVRICANLRNVYFVGIYGRWHEEGKYCLGPLHRHTLSCHPCRDVCGSQRFSSVSLGLWRYFAAVR